MSAVLDNSYCETLLKQGFRPLAVFARLELDSYSSVQGVRFLAIGTAKLGEGL
jgi:hypothetical protein